MKYGRKICRMLYKNKIILTIYRRLNQIRLVQRKKYKKNYSWNISHAIKKLKFVENFIESYFGGHIYYIFLLNFFDKFFSHAIKK